MGLYILDRRFPSATLVLSSVETPIWQKYKKGGLKKALIKISMKYICGIVL
jgi:hypothetical protein